jgi:Na+/melibiose symporter-like transporter
LNTGGSDKGNITAIQYLDRTDSGLSKDQTILICAIVVPVVLVVFGSLGAYLWYKSKRDEFKRIQQEAVENLKGIQGGQYKPPTKGD